ncbi:outer membrane beta-barrel family protein [Larkinella punicea]|uniref:TonB-dependent receptor n=1 Tax=Larkinella punicea TaxID=2315727 RepID=A0A368JJP2_9BACT|nr:outer membrane beta-barrel family protein [Larkinella punicea]RCR66341.1 TonB-dependent receptor [Larkinella punicea]
MKLPGLLFSTGILLILTRSAIAQTTYSLQARVINARQEPLAVDARLLSLPDSALLQGGLFPDGLVSFPAIRPQNAVLRLSSLSFADTLILVHREGLPRRDLGVIVLRERHFQLDEVRIRSQAPLVRHGSNGSVEVQVAGTILAGSPSVTQVLERSPGVLFNEGRMSVVGKGEALLFLNDQAITYEQLMAIPVSQIVRIEIIANPSSRYDAEGKAVIRIVTKTKVEKGLTGTVTQLGTYSDFAGGESNTVSDLNYRKGKLTMAANYALRTGHDREILHTTRTRPAAAQYLHSDLTTDWQRKLRQYSSFGLGVQYNPSEKTYFSLGYKGNLDRLGGNQYSRNRITDTLNQGVYNSSLAKNERRLNHSLIFNYNRTLDSLGSTLFLGSQVARFRTDVRDLIDENNAVNDSSFTRRLKNNQSYHITISSTQADYTKVISSNTKLETGLKLTYATTASATDFLVAASEAHFQLDPKLSSRFEYTEWLSAAYVNYSGAIGKRLRLGAGVRGEWTQYDLKTTAGAGRVIRKRYFSVFPTLFLTKTLPGDLALRLSYVAKITRPRYQALNPWVIYQDPFTTIQGNPNLVPEKVHSFEMGMNYRQFDLRGGYNYTLDPISGAALRGDGPNSYVLKGINLEKDHTFFITGSVASTIRWWNTTNTITLSRSQSIDHQYGFELVKPRPQLYAYTSNTFTIKDLFRIQLLAWYLGDRYYGLYHNNSRATVTLGLEKDFFKNAGKLRFTANDLFHQTNASGTYSVGETDIYFDRTYATSSFTIGLTYRFGKPLRTAYRSTSTAETEQNRAR